MQWETVRPTLRGTDHPILADREDLFDINLALFPIKTPLSQSTASWRNTGRKKGQFRADAAQQL